MMKINNFQGDLTDVSARKGALLHTRVIELKLIWAASPSVGFDPKFFHKNIMQSWMCSGQ